MPRGKASFCLQSLDGISTNRNVDVFIEKVERAESGQPVKRPALPPVTDRLASGEKEKKREEEERPMIGRKGRGEWPASQPACPQTIPCQAGPPTGSWLYVRPAFSPPHYWAYSSQGFTVYT
ncbi:hypothetical protein ACOMHN_038667 [Nucella lapillus]